MEKIGIPEDSTNCRKTEGHKTMDELVEEVRSQIVHNESTNRRSLFDPALISPVGSATITESDVGFPIPLIHWPVNRTKYLTPPGLPPMPSDDAVAAYIGYLKALPVNSEPIMVIGRCLAVSDGLFSGEKRILVRNRQNECIKVQFYSTAIPFNSRSMLLGRYLRVTGLLDDDILVCTGLRSAYLHEITD